LARARPGDMDAYEEILAMAEAVTGQGLREYERHPAAFDFQWPSSSAGRVAGQGDQQKQGERGREGVDGDGGGGGGESSLKAVMECHRPWWVCQAYVRPLPNEALEKGSLSLGKKAKRKVEREEEEGERKRKVQEEVNVIGQVRGERDEGDGVPREEIAKEAMVCG
ncbi:MAG: hypothetical protein Q9196_003566, partial [Gyalolechia fulgens]